MKHKRFFKILALLIMLDFAMANIARAQVFIMDDAEYNNNSRTPTASEMVTPLIPFQDLTTDQYAPIDGGLLLLCGFGVAFALGKRKAKNGRVTQK